MVCEYRPGCDTIRPSAKESTTTSFYTLTSHIYICWKSNHKKEMFIVHDTAVSTKCGDSWTYMSEKHRPRSACEVGPLLLIIQVHVVVKQNESPRFIVKYDVLGIIY